MAETSGVTVATLVHDLANKQSLVTLVWNDDATKRVNLPVTFGVALNDVHKEAEQALRALSAETASLKVHMPA